MVLFLGTFFCRITAGLKNFFKNKNKVSESEVSSQKDVAAPVELDVKPPKAPTVDADSNATTRVEEPKDAKGDCFSNGNSV